MKPLIITLAFLIALAGLAGAAIYLTSQQRPEVIPTTMNITPVPSVNVTGTTNLPQGGSSALDPAGVYSFVYPNDWRIDTSDPKHLRVFKTGATQAGQTEMYDGVIMVFETVSLNSKSLSGWTDDYIKSITADGSSKITQPKKSTIINNYPAYTLKARGLGESTYIVVQKTNASPNAVVITYMVADPENVGFQSEVDGILANLQLLK